MTAFHIEQVNAANQNGDYNKALELADLALRENPADAAFLIGKGNAYYGLGLFDKAAEAYETAAKTDLTNALALSNLAGIFYEQNRINEGLTASAEAIRRDPLNLNARLHYGNFLMLKNDYAGALKAYDAAEKINPEDELVLFNKANALNELNRPEQAEQTYQKLLKQKPNDSDLLSALAVVYEAQNKNYEAAETYLQLLCVSDTPTNHITLSGCLYNLLLQQQDIMPILDKWLEKFPTNPVALHTLKTLDKLVPAERASADYVINLFDAFADSFDSVLEGLDYQAPEIIANAAAEQSNIFDNVLDLGCGTGLCGAKLNEKIKFESLTGVDLSEGMIAKARQRNIYSALNHGDITEFKKPDTFSLIVCADVLTYLGDLSAVFSNVALSLKTAGHFIFTISENTDNPNIYAMELSGRFKHGHKYICDLLSANFKLIKMTRVGLRKELEETVQGLLFVVQKI